MSLNLLSLISNRPASVYTTGNAFKCICAQSALDDWWWVGGEKTPLGKSGPRLTVHFCLRYNCFINKINLPTVALHYNNILEVELIWSQWNDVFWWWLCQRFFEDKSQSAQLKDSAWNQPCSLLYANHPRGYSCYRSRWSRDHPLSLTYTKRTCWQKIGYFMSSNQSNMMN